MKTQISILVKNESLLSRFMSFLWFINIFKKMSVNALFDTTEGVPQKLKARKTPYVFDVEPGYHFAIFTDPRAGSKQAFKAVTGAFVGGAFGLAAGDGLYGAASGAEAFAGGSTVRDGVLECQLNEGDLLKVSVKPKHNGSVKVKILKK